MSVANHFSALAGHYKKVVARRVLAHRFRARHPTADVDPTALFDYEYDNLEHIKVGKNVSIGPLVQIIVFRKTNHSSVLGELSLGDNAVLSTGVNIRAAGGAISIGKGSGVGQFTVLVGTNHMIKPGEMRIHTPWDESRTGVIIGDNVWIGAQCVLLPGSRIGDNSVIAAGSVVRGEVPANEIWGGAPAKRLKVIEPVRDERAGA